jgi:EAL domain-containing protein (putative c-di-GMP-specific phosphodiesterase class I)
MYDAKEAGRNQVVTLSSDQLAAAPTEVRVTWVERIREALATDGFELYAQPVRPVHDAGTHYELLLRMHGPDGELVRPAAFLPIAERLDLVREIDRWVVGEAIELLERSRHDLSLEVNLSGRSIGDVGLLDFIERRLHEHDVDASRLIFEVTETGAVENFDRALMFARRLGDLGCRFALDDFGAGFGSFYYLKHLPFDYLKIDGEFVRRSHHNHVDQLVIDAVVHIAHALGKHTIAECVEDEKTASLLREHGVDYLQGHWIGRPEPAAQLLAA